MPTPSNRSMNASATFTPSGGSAVNFTGLKSAGYDEGISTKKEGADFDAFDTISVNDYKVPRVTIDLINPFVGYTTLAGQVGVLVVTVPDAKNLLVAGGGGKTITFSNCQIEQRGSNFRHREFGTQTLAFGGISADGSTHPIAVAAL